MLAFLCPGITLLAAQAATVVCKMSEFKQQVKQLRETRPEHARVMSFLDAQIPDDQVLLVGGSSRDLILGRESADVDLLLARCFDSADLARRLEIQIGGRGVGMVSPTFNFVRWHPDSYWRGNGPDWGKGGHIDLTMLLNGQMEVDKKLSDGDYTINCIGIDARSGDVQDPLGGYQDLFDGTLRIGGGDWTGESGFFRALRGLRFISEFDLTADTQTHSMICDRMTLLTQSTASYYKLWLAQSLGKVRADQPGYQRLQQMLDDPRVPVQAGIVLRNFLERHIETQARAQLNHLESAPGQAHVSSNSGPIEPERSF